MRPFPALTRRPPGLLVAALGLLVAACSHTEPWPTGPSAARPPLDSTTPTRITWQTLPPVPQIAWDSDGQGVVVLYMDPAFGDRPCLSRLPAVGGSREWTWCDRRGSLIDSVARVAAFGLSRGGRLAVLQGTYRRPVPPCAGCPTPPLRDAVGKSLWVSDRDDTPGHRLLISALPTQMGGLSVSWGTQITWLDEDRFVLAAARYEHDGSAEQPVPLQLVLVDLRGATPTMTPLPGTESAAAFTLDAQGNLLFLRGAWWTIHQPPPALPQARFLHDSVILRRNTSSGLIDTVAPTPVRLGAIDCAGSRCVATTNDIACAPPTPGTTAPTCTVTAPYTLTCLVRCPSVANQLVQFTPQSREILPLPRLSPSATVRISPDGHRLAVIRNGALYVEPLP